MSDTMNSTTGEVIRAEGLGKTYAEGKLHTEVFDGLDIRVDAGETVAILGASGAGKSTLLHLLGGLDVPTTGEVFVAGQKMSDLSDAARGRLRNRALGFIYQFHHLLPEFTALENVMMPVLLAGLATADAAQRARTLLESVGLAHRLHHKPGELSGGERQRIAIARALLTNPRILIFDEATSALDFESEHIIMKNLKQISAGRTMIMIAHRLSTVQHCDQISVIDHGRVAEAGSHEKLMQAKGLYYYLSCQQNREPEEKTTTA